MLRDFLIQAKFYSMFSFLFGWGMAIQMIRAQARGAKFVRLFVRRLLILLIIGILHATLFWTGDILTLYALLGFVLLLFRKRSAKSLLLASGFMLLLAIALRWPGDLFDAVRNWYTEITAVFHWPAPDTTYQSGAFAELVLFRFNEFAGYLANIFLYAFGNVFSMFLLGLYVGKRRIFENIEAHLSLLRRVLWSGLIIGILLNGLFVWLLYLRETQWPLWIPAKYTMAVLVGTRTIGAPALMLFYAAAIILLARGRRWRPQLESLAPLGRMALTNYLLQSVICSTIYNGYGLGLYARTGPTFNAILAIIIYLIQIRFSAWWLERYRFGPMEWIWRSLTYGRRQPLYRGQTLADVRPFPWKQRAGLLIVVLGLVGWYGYRNLRVDDTAAGALPLVAGTDAAITPTPIVPVMTPVPTAEPTAPAPIVPPAVQPVAFNPGAVVTGGDWGALAGSFDVTAALETIEILSGPLFDGRAAGTPGGLAAGDYIADQFVQLGLQPAGENGYFQPFPIHQTQLDGAPRLVVATAAGAIIDDYILYQDFAPAVRVYMGAGLADGDVVWANNCARDDFDGLDAVDKVVLCRGDWPRAEVGRNALEHGAAALLLLAGPDSFALDFTPVYYDRWVPDDLSLPTFRIAPRVAADLLAGSELTVPDLTINFTAFPLDSHVRLEIATTGPISCPDGECTARNVLAVLPGHDPAYTDELVIISGHYDHLGQAPDGVTWGGANDNASGIAAMLAIARAWQDAGYVPRRTVLFAAWDAEEIGLLGSRYYVENPRYDLSNTVGVINLDMVGAGEETLYLSGEGLESQVLAVSATMGITTTLAESGRSDHFPFQQAGVPAGTLIWFGDGDVPSYHRPLDTPDVIEPEKLAAVGRIAGLTALNLAEAGPQLDDLLARRAAAIRQNDLAAFLDTSQPAQRFGDRVWFADVASLSPISATMTADHIRLLGKTAVAAAQLNLVYLETVDGSPSTRTLNIPLPARFESGAAGWQWAGADLATAVSDSGDTFTIAYPADVDAAAMAGAAQFVSEQYAKIATLLGLPVDPGARLIFYPQANALRADTAISLPDGTNSWVGPDLVKLVYSGPITGSKQLPSALAQLLLAEAGVTETAVPWLWHGLAPVIAAETDLTAVQRQNLPVLAAAFEADAFVGNLSTDWAAVDYLRRQLGWEGLGQFIVAVGQNGPEAALQSALALNATQFTAARQWDWQARLAAANTAVDRVLAARAGAVFANNRAAFLGTVDESTPLILGEEDDWFDGLGDKAPISYSLTGELLALYEDGRLLANVTQVYEPVGGRGGTSQREILFTPGAGGLRWAGPPSEMLVGEYVTVLYPPGRSEAAQQFLVRADDLITRLPDYLTTGLSDRQIIRLPDDPEAAALLLARRQLIEMGVTDAWLLEGTAVYLASRLDDQIEQNMAANLHNLWLGVSNNRIGSVAETSAILQSGSENAPILAVTQAWDTIRYLVQTEGEAVLLALLQAQAQGQAVAVALPGVVGQSLAEFDAAWAESLGRDHAQPEWVAIADNFDVAIARQHLDFLSAPELAGRQAGSPGADAAAAYIAGQFAAYGLEPVPIGMTVITTTDSVTATVVPELSYFQPFTIEYAALTAVPRLNVGDDAFDYRRDFLTMLNEIPGGGLAEGELVFVQDGAYTGMDLSGKIVIRLSPVGAPVEMAVARAHGATGLVLVGDSDYEKDFQMKRPLPIHFDQADTIPTLLLTQIGLDRLLALAGLTRADLNTLPLALPLGLEAQMDVPLSQPEIVETANVLGLLPGSDPDWRDEVIILGAHYDHVGNDPGGLAYSGANDNASGVAALLALARLWQESGYRPARSILFAAWGAQEPGEIGSAYYVAHPALPLTDTVGVIILDAVGGGDGHRLMAQGNWEREGLLLFAGEQADLALDGRLRTNIPAGQSDDIPFRAAGIPTMLLTWTGASEDNWPDDLADEIDPDDLAVSGKMATLAVMTLAR